MEWGVYMTKEEKYAHWEALAIYDFDKDILICDYIKKQNKPIDIIDDKRIRII